MNEPCGCYYGGDCTKTTVCAVDNVREELEERIVELEAELAEYKTELCEVKAWKPEVKYSEALEQK